MAEASEADKYLLDQISQGSSDAWSQLVNRYHGRLLAFARSRLPKSSDADDFVQETFLLFLQSFRSFRRDASVETYLFTILRRRMIDHYRGRKIATCAIGEETEDAQQRPMLPSQHTPSWYIRKDEQTDLLEEAVAAGIQGLTKRLRDQEKLDELRAIELLFHAQARNKDIAALCNMDEKHIGLLKFRALEQIRDNVTTHLTPAQRDALRSFRWEDTAAADSILTRVWEDLRPTCPKRSTLGRLMLGTLESPWRDYVQFHVNQLGCRYCQANLEDLKKESAAQPTQLRQRIFNSTVGFLSKATSA
ncbi:MAG TPA: sigma-70 family RNA polymerase sigma factor [Tepidisphaeraceae bacterium]|jgi:RNA polymerase sigma factor (sigma-70 family)